MKIFKGFIRYLFLIHLFFSHQVMGQVVRIMPMGNSITYDENLLDEEPYVRPTGDRISYRYKLYQLLTAAGYTFDYVGSENAGNNYFQNTELDDNAGFPGINDAQMAYLLMTGYNQRAAQYEAPGPYLNYYPADIILLHIGTNDLEESPDDVEQILDYIRLYDSDVIILVARIINRNTYSSLTTLFNNNVESMVTARGDDRIISVNMETGAGINYSTDMIDIVHPNQTGYNKMAAKWFEVIDNLNTAPEVISIPQQSVIQGSAFNPVSLDNYVADAEDPDNMIQWTFRLQQNSKLSASVDGSRILRVSVTDANWYGTETITMKATDSGNGAFQKSDSVQVIYKVIKKNEPPVFTSTPVTNINEENNYNYTVTAQDNDGDVLTFSAVQIPAWLAFSTSTHVLSGRPSNLDVGIYNITLRVTDGKLTVDQNYQLTVLNVNDPPVITSTPATAAIIGEVYLYELTATDEDLNDALTYSFSVKPGWLNFANGSNKGILSGTPSSSNAGANAIILKVNDGHVDVIQGFTVIVSNQTALDDREQDQMDRLYPNPARDWITYKRSQPANIRLQFYDITGLLRKDIQEFNTNIIEIDISEFSNGIYIYKTTIDNEVLFGKLIVSD